jgi:hypothetical protein
MTQILYTIKLGSRIWETTELTEAGRFLFAFAGENAEPFKLSSRPYSGAEIPTVINVN